MPPEHHTSEVRVLVYQLVLLHHAVDPARHGDTRFAHHGGGCITSFDPVKVHTPDLGKMLPGALCQAVVTGQRIRVRANIGSTLYIVVAAEDIGATAGHTHIAQHQLQDARRTHHGIACGVLGLPHTPHNGGRAVLRHHLCGHIHTGLWHAASFLHFVRRPLSHDLFFDLVHAIDTVFDILFVFPAVLEDVVHHAEQEGNIGTGAQTNVLVGLGSRPRKAWVHHNHLAAGFLSVQHVQQADRVGFCGIGADVQRALAVLHVVVRIGHGAIAPGIGHTCHRGGVANTCLVIAVVTTPKTHPLPQQIRLLVVVLGRAHDVHGIWPTLLAQCQHPC